MNKLLTVVFGAALSAAAGAQQAAAENAPVEASAKAKPVVRLTTSKGVIDIELDPDKAPETVANFLKYVESGFYDGTIFHRVISHFMIQGGGFTADMQQKPTRPPITNEADNGLANARGTVAMARTGDPHSATAQFFINVQDNNALNHRNKVTPQGWGYAVFGKVIAGMEVVDDIRFVPTGNRGMFQDVPIETVTIEHAEVLKPAGGE